MNDHNVGRQSAQLVQLNGEFTANLLQRQDWQREALLLSERHRMLAESPLDSLNDGLVAPGRLSRSLGAALVRLGQRLQGQPQSPTQVTAK